MNMFNSTWKTSEVLASTASVGGEFYSLSTHFLILNLPSNSFAQRSLLLRETSEIFFPIYIFYARFKTYDILEDTSFLG